MNVHTESDAGPPATYQPKQTDEGARDGFIWRVWMHGASMFRFVVHDEATNELLHNDQATHPHAGKASRAANDWCREEARRREATADQVDVDVEAADAPPMDWAPELPPATVVAGWNLQVLDDGRGTYRCDVHNAATGEVATAEFTGYMAWGDALGDAVAWARANPCDGSEPEASGNSASPTEAVTEALRAADAEALQATEAVAEALRGAEPAPVETVTPARDPAPATPAAPAAQQAVLSAFDPRVDEAWSLLDARRALRREAQRLEGVVATNKAKLKAIQGELDEVEQQLDAVQEDSHRQVQMPLAPAPRTFANDAETRADIASQAAKQFGQLGSNAVTWSFLGVEYTIDVKALGEERFQAVFRGHPEIEGFGATREQAIEHAKNDASIRLENTDPGSSEKAHDAGPLADAGVPRSTKRKKPFEGKTADVVIAVLRGSKAVEEAIERLECTKPQLVKFLKSGGTEIADHLAKDTDLPEPPSARTKPRGAASKGGGRRGGKR